MRPKEKVLKTMVVYDFLEKYSRHLVLVQPVISQRSRSSHTYMETRTCKCGTPHVLENVCEQNFTELLRFCPKINILAVRLLSTLKIHKNPVSVCNKNLMRKAFVDY